MKLVIGINQSDSTYGWDGASKGFTLHFSHFTAEHVIQDQIIPLSSGLMPVINFKTIKKNYLGLPFTNCNNQTHPTNDYRKWELQEDDYSQRFFFWIFDQIIFFLSNCIYTLRTNGISSGIIYDYLIIY